MSGNYKGCSWQANTLITCLFFQPKFQKLFIFVIKKCFDIKYRFLNFFIVSGRYYFKDANASFYLYPTTQFLLQSFNLFVCFHICVWKGNQMSGFALHTPVLTSDNIIRSLMANVSPCFIFILFLSKHFIAYLKTTWKQWFYFLSVCIITTHLL